MGSKLKRVKVLHTKHFARYRVRICPVVLAWARLRLDQSTTAHVENLFRTAAISSSSIFPATVLIMVSRSTRRSHRPSMCFGRWILFCHPL